MKQSDRSDIAAIVVTYQPDLGVLGKLLDTLDSQVSSTLVVDNGSHADLKVWCDQRHSSTIELLLLDENIGIAAAQNLGIQWAQSNGAKFVLLMDQDSIPDPDMVQTLMFALLEAENSADFDPIAAGPICVDRRTGNKGFFVTDRNGLPRKWQTAVSMLTSYCSLEVSALISSGSLINLKALQNVGGMRSNYFIDHVDTEWCFRARAKGYILLGVPAAEMQHSLGDKVSKVWFFGWRHVAYHSPLRDYYMFRNTLLMLRDVKMSVVWRLYLLSRLVQFSGYFLIFAPYRMQRFRCMLLGVVHGVRGLSGKFDLKTSQCTPIPSSALDP